MKKAIVFGANGYLGRHLAFFLNKKNILLTPIDLALKSIDNYSNYKSINIVNSKEVDTIDFNVDYIFVFAGLTGTDNGFENYKEFIDVNEIGLLNILKHHKSFKSKARIIFPSTRLVYKGIENTPLDEGSEKEVKTIYAQNKLSSEGYLRIFQNYYNIDFTVFRICVPYGNIISDDYSYGTIGFFLSRAKNGKKITLYGDGKLKRTFTHIEDICEKIILAIQQKKSKNNIYNIGGENKSLLDCAKEIAAVYKVDIEFIKWPDNVKKIESGDTIFNAEKLHNIISDKYINKFNKWVRSVNL